MTITDEEAHRQATQYAYRVTWSAEDKQYLSTCIEFPSLSVLEDNPASTILNIMALVRGVLVNMSISGETPPEPLSAMKYSGQLRLRLPPALHRRLAIQAAEQKISLNRLIINKLTDTGD